MTDSFGNHFTKIVSNSTYGEAEAWYAKVATSGVDTVSVRVQSGSPVIWMSVYELTGLSSGSTVAVSGSGKGVNASITWHPIQSPPRSIVLAFVNYAVSAGTPSFTTGGGYTLMGNDCSGGVCASSEYLVKGNGGYINSGFVETSAVTGPEWEVLAVSFQTL